MVQTLEVPSAKHIDIPTHDEILRLIPQHEIKPIFLRTYLDREVVIGFIGDRGGGKSGSSAVVGTVDFGFAGVPLVSNMDISVDIRIDDETARKYGLNYGGTVQYRSEMLEKDALLKLDERYRGKCLVIEEINVQFSNVRRVMANTNVDFNEVCQQLRKYHTSLIYNVIDEMFIDPQLRALTDVFVKTYDMAFDVEAIASEKPTGQDFNWKIYPMSGYLAGEQAKYAISKKTLPPVIFNFTPWRDIYNTDKNQVKGIYSMSTKEKNKQLKNQMMVDVKSSPAISEFLDEWGWIGEILQGLKNQGIKVLKPVSLRQYLNISITKPVKDALRAFNCYYNPKLQGYTVGDFSLD